MHPPLPKWHPPVPRGAGVCGCVTCQWDLTSTDRNLTRTVELEFQRKHGILMEARALTLENYGYLRNDPDLSDEERMNAFIGAETFFAATLMSRN